MKKTLFVASLLLCSLPVSADSGMTLSGEGIANNCTWNLFATFDELAVTDTFTTLATVNLVNKNTNWDAIYAVGYIYSADRTLTLGMVSYANPNSWNTLSLGTVTLSSDTPVSFALSHNGSNEGGNNKLTFRAATGNTTTDIALSGPISSSAADGYSNTDISTVTLGTDATFRKIFNKDFVLAPATSGINVVSARLEHEAYSDTAFKEFILEEQPWADDETVRYTTVENGNRKNVYTYDTANGEVTFNPNKFTDDKLTLDTTIDLTARTTFIVEDGKTVEISGAETFTGAGGKQHEKGSVFGSGELVKSGGGTLAIRLNDTNRNIDASVRNDYDGSVTVEEGTLYLFHDDIVEKSDHIARLGGGEETVITVKEGATLEMGAQTMISIPLGAHSSQNEYAHNVVIDGGAVNVHADDQYGIPELHTKTSTLKDVVITRGGLDQVAPDVRAQLIVNGITVYGDNEADKVEFKHADIITDDFYYNGHTVIRNTNLWADETIIASSFGTDERYTLEVLDGSHVVYGAGADAYSEGAWGHVDNVYVDKTSKLQTAENHLDHDWGGALQIQGKCTVDIADVTLAAAAGPGLAVRENGTVEAIYQGKMLTLADIRYTTDQLSGDMLVKYDENAHGTLDLHLKDPASALPEGTTLTNTVFTLTLTNFDSGLLVIDEFGNLDPSAAKLTVDAFEGSQWHLVYGRYDKETNNSIFTFSTMENLKLAPEPATVTLSLLALAALAARRKRK